MNDRRHPPSRLFPCGLSRCEFVWEMGGGFVGLALSSLLAADGFFERHARGADPLAPNRLAPSPLAIDPLAARPQHFPSPAKACIFLMMNGGPSHVDTFDYKPNLKKNA